MGKGERNRAYRREPRPIAQVMIAAGWPADRIPTVNGDYIDTWCVECQTPMKLSLLDEFTGERYEPNHASMKFSTIFMCADCSEADEQAKKRAQSQKGVELRIREAHIPKAFRELSFEDMVGEGKRALAIKAAKDWAVHPEPHGLLLYGVHGAGKTRLAGTAAWLRLQVRPIRWLSVAVLFATLQASFSDDERKTILRTLRGVDGLVLDDIDKIALGDNSRAHLFVAIEQRVTAEAPLLVTSNLHPAELKAQFGAAISSRLLGYCAAYELPGMDRRIGMDV